MIESRTILCTRRPFIWWYFITVDEPTNILGVVCVKNSNLLEQKWLIVLWVFFHFNFYCHFIFDAPAVFSSVSFKIVNWSHYNKLNRLGRNFVKYVLLLIITAQSQSWVCKKKTHLHGVNTDVSPASAFHCCTCTSMNSEYSFCKGISFRVGHNFSKSIFFSNDKKAYQFIFNTWIRLNLTCQDFIKAKNSSVCEQWEHVCPLRVTIHHAHVHLQLWNMSEATWHHVRVIVIIDENVR